MSTKSNFLKCFFFLILLIFVLLYLGKSLSSNALSEGNEQKIFNQPKNTIDIFYLGNCHCYSAYIPSLIEKETNLHGYTVGASTLSAENTYYLFKYAIKNQDISFLVLETFPFVIKDSYIPSDSIETYSHIFVSELPFMDKYDYIKQHITNITRISLLYYVFDVFYFHDRWPYNEAFGLKRKSADNGWVEYWDNAPLDNPDMLIDLPLPSFAEEVDDLSLKSFIAILEEAKQRNISVILTTVPYTEMTEYDSNRVLYLRKIAERYGVPYIDFSSSELISSLNLTRGIMKDKNHVNSQGAVIISEYLADYITENFDYSN